MKKLGVIFSLVWVLLNCSEKDEVATIGPTAVEPDSVKPVGNPIKASLRINELQIENVDFLDGFGEDPSWVEIFNQGDSSIQLYGYSLAEKKEDSGWIFDSLEIKAGEYLLLYCSGRDLKTVQLPMPKMNLMSSDVMAWADGYVKGGNSEVEGLLFNPEYTGKDEGGEFVLSAVLKQRDNAPALNWASAQVQMGFKDLSGKEIVELSEYESLEFWANFPVGKKLQVRLLQEGLDDWLGWKTEVEGKGQWEKYSIELELDDEILDILYGIKFEAPANGYDDIPFSVKALMAIDRGQYFHTNFKLNKDGGSLFLKNPKGEIIDFVQYDQRGPGISIGRAEGSLAFAKMEYPTPGLENSNYDKYGKSFQDYRWENLPASGFYREPIQIGKQKNEGVEFRYTVNGDSVSLLSKELENLELKENMSLRIGMFDKQGILISETVRNYVFDEKKDLPVVFINVSDSLMFDPINGLYELGENASDVYPYFGANFWQEKELKTQIEYYDKGKTQWSSQAGLRIFGNYSRAHDKKSLSVHFREEYGQSKINYPLFEHRPNLTEFKTIVLRNGGNNFGKDYVRDGLMSTVFQDLNVESRSFTPAILYINGKYWGIHNIREKIAGGYFKTNFNYDDELIDLIKPFDEVQMGSGEAWNEFVDWAEQYAGEEADFFRVVDSVLDLDNYFNYLIGEVYFGNTDWPANNFKVWKPRIPGAKWRYIVYDVDFGIDAITPTDEDMIEHILNDQGEAWPNGPVSTALIRALLSKTYFLNLFIQRTMVLLGTEFSKAELAQKLEFWKSKIAKELPIDAERWELSESRLEDEYEKMDAFFTERPDYLVEHLMDHFSLSSLSTIDIDPKEGVIFMAGIPIRQKTSLKVFTGVPIWLTYSGNEVKWWDGDLSKSRSFTPTAANETISVLD